jgi:hypothetical protein
MKPSLKNPKLKVERAKEHLDILNIEMNKFIDMKPPHVSAQEDIKNALYILRIQIPIIDPKLGIIAGDAIYSLRSALDHIAWQLALTTTDRPHNRTTFPIVDKDTPEKMQTFGNITRDIPADAVNEIKVLQPYLRGASYKDDLLWKLNKLCNIDKHRVIPAHGTAFDFKVPKGIKLGYGRLNDTYIVTMPIAVKTKMQFAPPPTFDILFGSEVDGLVISVIELRNIYKFIRDKVFPRFASFFSE